MSELQTIPENCREGYAKLVSQLVKLFSLDKRSGKSIVQFKEGVPVEIEPSPRIRLDK